MQIYGGFDDALAVTATDCLDRGARSNARRDSGRRRLGRPQGNFRRQSKRRARNKPKFAIEFGGQVHWAWRDAARAPEPPVCERQSGEKHVRQRSTRRCRDEKFKDLRAVWSWHLLVNLDTRRDRAYAVFGRLPPIEDDRVLISSRAC